MDWNGISADYLAVAAQVFEMQDRISAIAEELAGRVRADGKVLFCGNGGSAADAQHFAGEFVNRFLRERRPYAGLALTTDASVMTAIANDYDFGLIFEKQVQALGRPGDALVAISTSGNAPNVLNAVQAAKKMGIWTLGMTGGTGGRLAGLADALLCVDCTRSTPRIQEGHQLLLHLLCERVEEILQ